MIKENDFDVLQKRIHNPNLSVLPLFVLLSVKSVCLISFMSVIVKRNVLTFYAYHNSILKVFFSFADGILSMLTYLRNRWFCVFEDCLWAMSRSSHGSFVHRYSLTLGWILEEYLLWTGHVSAVQIIFLIRVVHLVMLCSCC